MLLQITRPEPSKNMTCYLPHHCWPQVSVETKAPSHLLPTPSLGPMLTSSIPSSSEPHPSPVPHFRRLCVQHHLPTEILQTTLLNNTHPCFTGLLKLNRYFSLCVFLPQECKLIKTLEQKRHCSMLYPQWGWQHLCMVNISVTSWVKERCTSYFMCTENYFATLFAKFFIAHVVSKSGISIQSAKAYHIMVTPETLTDGKSGKIKDSRGFQQLASTLGVQESGEENSYYSANKPASLSAR